MASPDGGRSRTLVLVRHAKASSSAPTDHARDLVPSGHRAAADVGRWLAARIGTPDLVMVSDAHRTTQTWEDIALAAEWSVTAESTASLYAAGPQTLLDILREIGAEHETVVVVGHNPTIAYLAEALDDGEGDPDAVMQLVSAGYPPSATTVLAVHGEWSGLSPSQATVTGFHVGDG